MRHFNHKKYFLISLILFFNSTSFGAGVIHYSQGSWGNVCSTVVIPETPIQSDDLILESLINNSAQIKLNIKAKNSLPPPEVDCGGGTKDSVDYFLCKYSNSERGEKRIIKVSGQFDRSSNILSLTNNNLIDLKNWGKNIFPSDLSNFFAFERNFQKISANDVPNFSQVTNTSSMFRNTDLFNSDINFDTSKVTNMIGMFAGAVSFNKPVNLNTSSVTNMNGMFQSALLFNQEINFNTSKVTDMSYMFYNAKAFNNGGSSQSDKPLNLDIQKVTTMQEMFSNTDEFNQSLNFGAGPNVLTNASSMFQNAKKFNRQILFNTSNVTNMSGLFANAPMYNQPVQFETSNVTNMGNMFAQSISFNQPINFNTSKVTNMNSMFYGATVFNHEITMSMEFVQDARHMFENATSFNNGATNGEIKDLKIYTKRLAQLNSMFKNARNFNQKVQIIYPDCLQVGSDSCGPVTLSSMFQDAIKFNRPIIFSSVNDQDVSNLAPTISATDYMFSGALLFNQELQLNFRNARSAVSMFEGALEFNNGALSIESKPFVIQTHFIDQFQSMFKNAKKFNQPVTIEYCPAETNTSLCTQGPRYLDSFFEDATSFNKTIQINKMNNSSRASMNRMFKNATSFNQNVYINTENVSSMTEMFQNASSFNQNLSLWCVPFVTQYSNFSTGSLIPNNGIPQWGQCPPP